MESLSSKELRLLRTRVKKIDRLLINLLAKRAHLTDEIGRIKKIMGQPVRNLALEKIIYKERSNWAKRLKLETPFVHKIFKLIIAYSVKRQRAITKKQ